jgi:translation initiation factor RLI1
MKKIIQETEEQKRQKEVVEEIARNISSLAKSVSALLGGQLSRRAIVTLLAQSSGQYKNTVEDVLSAIENLEKDWLNK